MPQPPPWHAAWKRRKMRRGAAHLSDARFGGVAELHEFPAGAENWGAEPVFTWHLQHELGPEVWISLILSMKAICFQA